MQTLCNAIQINHCLLKPAIKNADLIIDATCGNGHDTLFLAQNTAKAHIYAFDIQKSAIENTRQKTIEYNDRIKYICDSHINIRQYINGKHIDTAVFNLGYLPKASHQLTTKADTTIKAIDIIKDMLNTNGIISVLAYPGHQEGHNEYMELLEYTGAMDKYIFTVGWYCLHNHPGAPALCWIEKQR